MFINGDNAYLDVNYCQVKQVQIVVYYFRFYSRFFCNLDLHKLNALKLIEYILYCFSCDSGHQINLRKFCVIQLFLFMQGVPVVLLLHELSEYEGDWSILPVLPL